MGSHLPRRTAPATRDGGKGQDIRQRRNSRTNGRSKAPHPRCWSIVILSVEPGGNAAGLLPDCVREVRRRKAVDIHALCLPRPRTKSAGKAEIQLDIFNCLRYNTFEKQSDTVLFVNKHFVEYFLKSDIIKSQKRF